jgi:prophage regulatory protein
MKSGVFPDVAKSNHGSERNPTGPIREGPRTAATGEQLVQLSRSTIYAAVKAGTFPAPVRIGARAVAWRVSEVEQWLEARPLANATV